MKLIISVFLVFLSQNFAFARSVSDLETQIQNHRARADSLQNLISLSERRISELAQSENEHLSRLNEMEKAIDAGRYLISIVQKQIDSLDFQMDLTAKSLMQTQIRLDSHREVMAMRLRRMQKIGQPSILSVILGASSPADVINRIRSMQDLNRYDRNLIYAIRQNELELIELNKIYEAENAHLQELLSEHQEEHERVSGLASDRRAFLTEVRTQRSTWEISRNEFQSAQEELSSMIEALIAQIAEVSFEEEADFAGQRGNLPWAVNGRVISNFGRIVHPQYRTVIINNGIDIEATTGTPVKSVAAGVVEFIGRMRGHGKLIIINHFNGFLTIYAHLNESKVERGQRVRQGEVIAAVGESGSLEGSRLHFEIRQGSTALNPIEWLVSN